MDAGILTAMKSLMITFFLSTLGKLNYKVIRKN